MKTRFAALEQRRTDTKGSIKGKHLARSRDETMTNNESQRFITGNFQSQNDNENENTVTPEQLPGTPTTQLTKMDQDYLEKILREGKKKHSTHMQLNTNSSINTPQAIEMVKSSSSAQNKFERQLDAFLQNETDIFNDIAKNGMNNQSPMASPEPPNILHQTSINGIPDPDPLNETDNDSIKQRNNKSPKHDPMTMGDDVDDIQL